MRVAYEIEIERTGNQTRDKGFVALSTDPTNFRPTSVLPL